MSWTMVQAISPVQDAEGYVITSKLKSHNKHRPGASCHKNRR